jgi:threonine dehydrogenase-like Zn-dependent dehydrogenase
MKTKAVRLYDKNLLKMEEFELPEIKEDEILVKNITDSICMSTYKAAILGKEHKRVPNDIDINPVIVGHEFAGEIVKVGSKWSNQFKVGKKFAIQPALNYKGSMASPGYSYKYFGGAATYTIIPQEVMELGCLLNYDGESFYEASLSEPMSCIIGAYHASYHTIVGKYEHKMGIVEGGKMALLAAAGPMGFGAIDYALHCDRRPGMLVIADIDDKKLKRAESIFTKEESKKCGVELVFVNTKDLENPTEYLKSLTGDTGFDDVFVYTPISSVVELGDSILARDGCLNFFAGPTDNKFSAKFNFYNVHYTSAHIVGTSGGNTNDMIESLQMSAAKIINPAVMITHIGGLDSVAKATLDLPKIPGGKKLIYTNIEMELTDIQDFDKKGKTSPLFAGLAKIVNSNNGLWCVEAERFLLANYK